MGPENGTRFDLTAGLAGVISNHASRTKESRRAGSGLVYHVHHRAGVVVPVGVLFGSTKGAKKDRELLLTECEMQAVIAMPSGVFKPYSGVSTAALIFQKRQSPLPLGEGKGEGVWFYDVTADGFSLDDKRNAIDANDIPDRWSKCEEGINSWRVPVVKIIENDYSLAAGRYKPVTVEAVRRQGRKWPCENTAGSVTA